MFKNYNKIFFYKDAKIKYPQNIFDERFHLLKSTGVLFSLSLSLSLSLYFNHNSFAHMCRTSHSINRFCKQNDL